MTRIPASELSDLRHALRRVMRGLWRRRRPPLDARLGRRHIAVLAYVASADRPSVGQVAEAIGLTLPAASKLARELEAEGFVHRREHPDDRRRTLLELDERTAPPVQAWLAERDRPLITALEALTPEERTAFLKGMNALAEALMRESEHGALGPDDRPPHRRRAHRHRPV